MVLDSRPRQMAHEHAGTATVYRICERGDLQHFRISCAIRISGYEFKKGDRVYATRVRAPALAAILQAQRARR